jgi:hypothetical protein
MPDFCGGLMVYSPSIMYYDKSNSWTTRFACPGGDESLMPTTEWCEFKPENAIDLNVLLDLKIDDVTSHRERVEEYLYQCIAAQIAGELLYHGKRGWMGADNTHGRMRKLVGAIGRMGAFIATPVDKWKCDDIADFTGGPRPGGSVYTSVVRFWTELGTEWYNSNSGNTVTWISGGLEATSSEPPSRSSIVCCSDCGESYNRNNYDECPECGYDDWYYDDDYDEDDEVHFIETRYHVHEYHGIINTGFASRANHFFWRNG